MTVELDSLIKTIGSNLFVSTKDQDYISHFKNRNRQMASLIVRKLARSVLNKITGLAEQSWEFSVQDTKSRLAISTTGDIYHVSFSHSPTMGAVAISKEAIGIDIEERKPGRPWQSMIDFLDLPENAPAISNELDFLHYWTAHEAEIKFRSASEAPITYHHSRPSPDAVLCVASSFNATHTPELMTLFLG